MRAHFMLWEQFIRPNLKNMRTLVIKPHKGYENTAPLSYPDTWVRKPDCLHLPYTLINSLLDNCTAEGEGRNKKQETMPYSRSDIEGNNHQQDTDGSNYSSRFP